MLFRPTPDGMGGDETRPRPRLNRFRTAKQKFSRATSVNIRLDTVGLKRDGVLVLSAHFTTSLLVSSRRSLAQGFAFALGREPDSSCPSLQLSSFNLHVHTGITQLLEHCLRNFVEIRLHGSLRCCQVSYDFPLTLTRNFAVTD
jgi:hypothetical protein